MAKQGTLDREQILRISSAFRGACVLGAAAELDLFTRLGGRARTAGELAALMKADLRATAMLLDALAALRLLEKRGGRYRLPSGLRPLLMEGSPRTLLASIRHHVNIMRRWSELARVVKSGKPAARRASIRGLKADRAAFIAAMHGFSGPFAEALVRRLGPPRFRRLLDVGGASGTWTLAFLKASPGARATIFDLPDAIAQARRRLAATGALGRVALVPGDFYKDELPAGADLAWVSAIAHQHSRRDNRDLFRKVYAALSWGGRILIRDFVLEENRTRPLDGALFAINMLVGTKSGGTFTFEEFAEDLKAAGFRNPRLLVEDERMHSVVGAVKPAQRA